VRKLGKELEFISMINRDGLGVTPVSEVPNMVSYLEDEELEIMSLSLTNRTFIATDRMNYYIVRIKKEA